MYKRILLLSILFVITIRFSPPVYGFSLPEEITSFFQRILNIDQSSEGNQQLPEALLLPDLIVDQPEEIYIEYDNQEKKIRFSTTAINIGEGELRIQGTHNIEQEVTRATQLIQQNGSNEYFKREIGTFEFHPDHDHWHVEDFTQFQLWTYDIQGELDTLLATTDKMSFCLWDEERLYPELKNSPDQRIYPNDCDTDIQGISIGWADTYGPALAGQELTITSIPDGNYAIRSVINPERHIIESDYDNNEVIMYIILQGNIIREISEEEAKALSD